MINNRLMKYWNRTTAVIVLIVGVLMTAAGIVDLILAPADAGLSFSLPAGLVVGIGAVAIAQSVVWFIRARSMTDEQIKAHFKQLYDERYHSAFSKAAEISSFITILYLVVCGVVFLVLDQQLAGWLFMGGAYVLLITRSMITRVILLRS